MTMNKQEREALIKRIEDLHEDTHQHWTGNYPEVNLDRKIWNIALASLKAEPGLMVVGKLGALIKARRFEGSPEVELGDYLYASPQVAVDLASLLPDEMSFDQAREESSKVSGVIAKSFQVGANWRLAEIRRMFAEMDTHKMRMEFLNGLWEPTNAQYESLARGKKDER